MREIVYVAPRSVGEALAEMSKGDGRLLAGGTDLVPQLREGRRQAGRIVDLKRIAELTAIEPLAGGGVLIGAAASATRVSRDKTIAARYPAVAASARLIGGVQVQNRASLGGNICNAAPSADAVPALICLAARAKIAGPDGARELLLEELFIGPGRTALAPGELLTGIILPPVTARSAATYLRFTPRREMDIAIAGVAVHLQLSEAGAIELARVAMASVGPTPLRAPSAESKLRGNDPAPGLFAEAGRAAANDARPISDTRGSAEYRRSLVAVLTERALTACVDELHSRSAAA